MRLDDAIEKRHSVREYNSKKVRWDYVIEAIDAALKAPFAGNQNTLRFVIVGDQNKKNMLAQAAQQDWIADASIVVVVCSDYSKLETLYHKRAEIYGRQHAGAAIQNFLLKVTDMKMASCWVGAYLDEAVKKALNIPKGMHVEALLPVSYESRTAKRKQPKKAPLQGKMYWDRWGASKKPTGFKDPATW